MIVGLQSFHVKFLITEAPDPHSTTVRNYKTNMDSGESIFVLQFIPEGIAWFGSAIQFINPGCTHSDEITLHKLTAPEHFWFVKLSRITTLILPASFGPQFSSLWFLSWKSEDTHSFWAKPLSSFFYVLLKKEFVFGVGSIARRWIYLNVVEYCKNDPKGWACSETAVIGWTNGWKRILVVVNLEIRVIHDQWGFHLLLVGNTPHWSIVLYEFSIWILLFYW